MCTCSWIMDSKYYFKPIQCSSSRHHLNPCAHLSCYFVRKNSICYRGKRYTSYRWVHIELWIAWFMISAQFFLRPAQKSSTSWEKHMKVFQMTLLANLFSLLSMYRDLTTFLGEEEESSWHRFLKVKVYSFNLFLNYFFI